MILVLEETDLPDEMCEAEEYDPYSVSVEQFQVENTLIERARIVTFRFYDDNTRTYRDLKNRNGSTSSNQRHHPKI